MDTLTLEQGARFLDSTEHSINQAGSEESEVFMQSLYPTSSVDRTIDEVTPTHQLYPGMASILSTFGSYA
jgi:hypothetical protein